MENRSSIYKASKQFRMRLWYYRRTGLLSALLLIGFALFSAAQDETAIRKIMKNRDLKKLDIADKIKNEADKNAAETERFKQEIESIKRDSELKERTIKRKVRLLETKSWQNEVQTSALYAKSNKRKYIIYKKYLNGFWNEHEGQESKYLNAKMLEEQARDNFAQATVYRRRTKHMNLGIAKIEKLTEASNLESVAIRRQVASLAECFGISGTSAVEVVSSSTEILPFPKTDTLLAVTLKSETDQAQVDKEKPAVAVTVVPEVKPPELPPAVPAPLIVEEDTGEAIQGTEPEKDNRVLFRIQISASRILLTPQELAKINTGNYPVEAVSEGGWFKYQLIGVPFFSDAQRILREANVKGSFIVAYRNGQKLNPADLIKENKELEKRLRGEGKSELTGETVYHVVLLVSKKPLKPEEAARLYHGSGSVLLILEKGMYEYHLNAGTSQETAEALKQKSGVSGNAIVSYKNAKRTSTNEHSQ